MTSPSPMEQDHSAGLLYDQYQVERTLGRGAMGVVYLARDLRIGRRVALKTIPTRNQTFDTAEAEQEFLLRFRREAELCGSLLHPNITALYEVGWEGKRVSWLAMEYVEGESLISLLGRNGTLSLEATTKIVDDVLQGLSYAHSRNVVHRDIKPANILISVEGQAKITDFGVARYARSTGHTLTDVGQLIGTPYYMSPELIAGQELDARSDLFSVGVMMFEMLSSRRPFEGDDLMDVLYAIVNAPAPEIQSLRPDLPRWVSLFLRRLLAKKPADRFLSAASASAELRRLLGIVTNEGRDGFLDGSVVPVESNLAPEDTPTTPITLDDKARHRILRLNRHVSTPLGVGVIAFSSLLLLSLVGYAVREIANTESSASGAAIHSAEVEDRRDLLKEAAILYEAGRYEQSLERYRAYLDRAPHSQAAIEGEQKVMAAMEAEQREKERRWQELQEQRRARANADRRRARANPPVATTTSATTSTSAGEEITVASASAIDEPVPPAVKPKRSFWSRIFKQPTPQPPATGSGQ